MTRFPRLVALAAAALALVSAAGAARAANVPQMLARHGCSGCHAAKQKIVGPAWGWVAYRYKGTSTAKAASAIASFIIDGGTGYWTPWTGGIPMPSHPNIKRAQATEMARWILSQTPVQPPAKPGS